MTFHPDAILQQALPAALGVPLSARASSGVNAQNGAPAGHSGLETFACVEFIRVMIILEIKSDHSLHIEGG